MSLCRALRRSRPLSTCSRNGERRLCTGSEEDRSLLEGLASKLGFETSSNVGWRRVTNRVILKETGGKALLQRHGGVLAALQKSFPEHRFDERLCRRKMPNGYWDRSENRRAFLESFAARRGISSPEDWKRVTHRDIYGEGGRSLLARHDWSLLIALQELFPEMEFSHSATMKVPDGYWDCKERRREFFERIRDKYSLGMDETKWRTVTLDLLRQEGGGGLMNSLYKNSILTALRDVFSEKEWSEYESRRAVRPGYWENEEHIVKFMAVAAKELELTSPEQWGRVSREQLKSIRGGQSLLSNRTMAQLFEIGLPGNKAWRDRPVLLRKAQQRHLLVQVSSLFPDDRTRSSSPVLEAGMSRVL